MAHHDISIDREFKGGVDFFRVNPPHQHVSSNASAQARGNDKVTWTTEGTAVTLWFPGGKPFEEEHLKIPAGASGTLTVKNDAKPGDYPYVVYCDDWERSVGSEKAFAEGQSHPIIIVD